MSKTSPNEELMTALTLHYDALVEYIRLRFNGKHFARDLVHDVCIQILENRPRKSRTAFGISAQGELQPRR